MIAIKTPCVITVTKPSWDPRYPSIKSKMAANRAEIPTIGFADLTGIDPERVGLKGSPTKVKKTFTPPVKSGCIKIQEETGADTAVALFKKLVADGIV